jgi:hypothetical protein
MASAITGSSRFYSSLGLDLGSGDEGALRQEAVKTAPNSVFAVRFVIEIGCSTQPVETMTRRKGTPAIPRQERLCLKHSYRSSKNG